MHVNEEIPGDSLAATGTRFQRQIRTDRVRPPGARSRASTGGSTGSHHRGHARNLSTSSIGSTTSNASTISTMSDFVRDGMRPHSLNLSDRQSPRGGLTIDTLRASPQNAFAYQHPSPSGASTPTYVYSNTPSSPYGSTLGSPISIPRNLGPWNDRAAGRRLSVPTGASPFQTTPGTVQGQPYLNPLAPSSSSQASSNNSTLASPTSSTYSFSRYDPVAEAEWRRRTWHPTTYSNYNQQRPATSGLSYSQTPDAPRPAFAPQALAAASHTPRLPGIETFDQLPQRPPSPARQLTSLQNEPPNRPPLFSSSSDRNIPSSIERRGHISWDMSLHHNLTKLDIASGTPPKEAPQWIQQTIPENRTTSAETPQHVNTQQQQQQPSSHSFQQPSAHKARAEFSELDQFPQPPSTSQNSQASQPPSVPPPIPQRARRHGWHNPALAASQHTAPAPRPASDTSSSGESVRTPVTISSDPQPTVVQGSGNADMQAAPHPSASVSKLHGMICYRTDSDQKTPKASMQSIYSAFPTPPQSNIYNAFPTPPSSVPRSSQPAPKPDTSGLDALVAVATSESRNQLKVGR